MDIEKLERLQKLRESGALTDEEFQREKQKLMNEDVTRRPQPTQAYSYQQANPNYNANPQLQNNTKKNGKSGVGNIIGIILIIAGISYLASLSKNMGTVNKKSSVSTSNQTSSSNTLKSSASTSNNTSSSNTLSYSNPWQSKFEISDTKSTSDGYAQYIEGTITNKTNRKMSYVQVVFNLYDDSGAQIGTAMDNINNLEANGKWKFKAISLDFSGKATKYKLSEITGF